VLFLLLAAYCNLTESRNAPVHNVVVEKPYVFSPPYAGQSVARVLQKLVRRQLRREFGIVSVEVRGLDRLIASHSAGHGILLTPNHCRPGDPLVVGEMARQAGLLLHIMASAHLFAVSRLKTWLLRRSGAFSVYREGVDRPAINAAISILEEAKRPLVIFPEGHITRSNARLGNLMDGTAFIARNAAKKRAQHTPPGQVVIHPIAIAYFFKGDIRAAISPALDDIEKRLSWRPLRDLPLVDRITKVGGGLLALKEIEFLGQTQSGTLSERLSRLIDHLLVPLEKEWLKEAATDASVVDRVKKLRSAVLPEMIQGEIAAEERDRRWRQLADMYLAQQLSLYPQDYLTEKQTPERMLETVERFEEDLTDTSRIYRPMTAVVQVGEAIVVPTARDRGSDEDPVMAAVERQLNEMLGAVL
jgi:1-acyl-sn-glycerol-3-phosphate acyltransferase